MSKCAPDSALFSSRSTPLRYDLFNRHMLQVPACVERVPIVRRIVALIKRKHIFSLPLKLFRIMWVVVIVFIIAYPNSLYLWLTGETLHLSFFNPREEWSKFSQIWPLISPRMIWSVVQVVAGLAIVYFSIKFVRQLRRNKRNQKIEEDRKHLENMLGNLTPSIQRTAIEILGHHAKNNPDDWYFHVQNMFCNFLRIASRDDENKYLDECTLVLRAFSDLRTPCNKQREEKAGWQADLNGVTKRAIPHDCRGLDLSRMLMNDAVLPDVDFSKSDLTGTSLHHADLQGSNFTDAKLNVTSFQSANLENTDFTGTDLNGANLFFAKLDGAILHAEDLEGAGFRKPVLPPQQWPHGWRPSGPNQYGNYEFERIMPDKV